MKGELSANAAAIKAGWRKKPTPLDTLLKAWDRASEQDRETFCATVRLVRSGSA